MSRVITFSTKFPKGHPKEGQPTYFVDKIWTELQKYQVDNIVPNNPELNDHLYRWLRNDFTPKLHTIRNGKRWKAGDWFSPRIWSGKPYASKQITIAPDIQLVRVADIEISDVGYLSIDGIYKGLLIGQDELAKNDGLSNIDLNDWFNKLPFSGQILIWSNKQLLY